MNVQGYKDEGRTMRIIKSYRKLYRKEKLLEGNR